MAFLIYVTAFTVLATSPLWLPSGGKRPVLALLALVCLVGEAIRWHRRRRARSESRVPAQQGRVE